MNQRIVLLSVSALILGLAAAGVFAQDKKMVQKSGAQANLKTRPAPMEMAATDPEVTKLESAAAKLAKEAKSKPKDAKLKLKVADAYYNAGHAAMNSAPLPSRIKYRLALKHFRTALAFNPKHEKAASEKKMIEDIYKQMGRPVPQ
jgi:Flp pilus assembly protein TadD